MTFIVHQGLRWLYSGAKDGDRLFIHCMYLIVSLFRRLLICTVSGHGSQIQDEDGDEADGLDEGAIEPLRTPLTNLLRQLFAVPMII